MVAAIAPHIWSLRFSSFAVKMVWVQVKSLCTGQYQLSPPSEQNAKKKNFLKEIFWVLSNCSRFPIRFPRPQPGNEARPPLLFVFRFVFSIIHGSKRGSTSVPQIKEQKPGRHGNEAIFAAPAFLLETEWQLGTTVPTKPRFSLPPLTACRGVKDTVVFSSSPPLSLIRRR